ncbi:MAG: hypothetical protein ACRD2F_09785 [Terriglobales bacterium]
MGRSAGWTETLAAGLLAGVAATAAMDGYWRVMKRVRPLPARGDEPAPSRVAADLLRRSGFGNPNRRARHTGGQALHWAYGMGWGIAAAAARRAGFRLDIGLGQPLGAALELGGDLGGMDALGYARHPREYPPNVIAQAFGGHAVYGAALWASLEAWDRVRHGRRGGRLRWPRAA